MGNNRWVDRQKQPVCSWSMTDESSANEMKRRAEEALKKKLAAQTNNAHADTKATGKTGAKGARQPKQRIIRHQGR